MVYSFDSRLGFLVLVHKAKKKLKEIKNGEFVVVIDELLYEKQGELRTEASFYKGKRLLGALK
jgi:hypothetical protein